MNYLVNDIYPTVQGEGVLTGVPVILLRLHGCDVGCPWCDTKETWEIAHVNKKTSIGDALGATEFWAELSASEIVAAVMDIAGLDSGRGRWVMVTGGEPADQDLEGLVNALHDAHFRVSLETSGTAIGHVGVDFDWVCVSPKIGMPGGRTIIQDALSEADEIKHVVGKQQDIDNLDLLITTYGNVIGPDTEICLQPVSMSEKATELCIKTVTERNWRLSIQAHKAISIR